MKNKAAIPEVTKAIEEYFENARMNQISVAKALEISPQAVSQQLKLPFGRRAANKWAEKFGFNAEFLMTGKGELKAETQNPQREETTPPSQNKQGHDSIDNENNWKALYESAHRQNDLLHQLIDELKKENAQIRQMLNGNR